MNGNKVGNQKARVIEKIGIPKKKYFFLKNLIDIKKLKKNKFQNFYAKKHIIQFLKLKISIIKIILGLIMEDGQKKNIINFLRD